MFKMVMAISHKEGAKINANTFELCIEVTSAFYWIEMNVFLSFPFLLFSYLHHLAFFWRYYFFTSYLTPSLSLFLSYSLVISVSLTLSLSLSLSHTLSLPFYLFLFSYPLFLLFQLLGSLIQYLTYLLSSCFPFFFDFSVGCIREGTMARSSAAHTGDGETVIQTEYAGVIWFI